MGVANDKARSADPQQSRDEGLRKAIGFSKIMLLINLIYFGWRATHIAKSIFAVNALQVAAFVAFLIIEWTYAVTGLLNALLLTGLGKKWTPQKPMRIEGNDVPYIDIFLPCYGESLDIIRDTVLASIHQDYPADKYRVVLLDDGNSAEAKHLISKLRSEHPAARLYYAARGSEVKIHSKAANIQYGLEHVRTLEGGAAPYFGLLDIDMIPTRQWLRNTIPFLLEDKQVALAGSAQKFYNLPKGFTLASRYHLETDVMQRLFDANKKALCMGSGYLARCDVFESLGGFPTMVKQEDTFIVSIILQAHGYKTRLLEEEHQHGLYALTFTDVSKAHAKWMSGIIHAYSLFSHPIMSGKPLGTKIGGVFPILHLTVLRLFMMLSLPTILLLARSQVVPNVGSNELALTMVLAAAAYSSSYVLSWYLSIAANGTVSLDDGQRLWHLPYQFKGLWWLVQHSLFGEAHMPKFVTTGADALLTKKFASSGALGRFLHIVVKDGAWMHLTYFTLLVLSLWQTAQHGLVLRSTSPSAALAASVFYPPFTKILAECLYQALIPIQYLMQPNPDLLVRETLLNRDAKTGVATPKKDAITPPTPPFWGTLGYSGFMWAWFGAAPVLLANAIYA